MSTKRGFTLVEVLMAIVILTIIAVGIARFAGLFSKAMTKSSVRIVASGVASDRLELVRADPRYTSLVTLYGSGAGADTTGFPGFPQMHRLTNLSRDQSGSPARDRTTVTVRVIDPGLKDTIAVTTIIARP